MKTIFDAATRDQLIQRIGLLNKTSVPLWGKMTVIQMLRHNTYWNKWVLGTDEHTYKQDFIGKVFGKIALKKMIKDEQVFDKNLPTSKPFKIKDSDGDIESEKTDWIRLTREFENFNNPDFIHDFFGKMTKEEIGILAYKHSDHHLRQFNV